MAAKALLARPLLLSGAATVVGVVLAQGSAAWPLALGVLLGAWAGLARTRTAVLVLAALAAGSAAGWRLRARTDRTLEAMASHWPRAPPRAGVAELEVLRCGEDPFRERAWLEGRRDDGLGVLCVWPGARPPPVAPGARVRVAGRFYVPRPPGNPGERDGRRRLAARGVAVIADLRTEANVEVVRAAPASVGARLAEVRRTAAARLRAALPSDVAPLATALLLGLRTGIAPEDRLLFERTGTMHILAISGMHLLLLASLVHASLRAAGLGPRAAAGITLLLALAYVPVAGGAPPIRRAVTVLVAYGLALVRGRPPDVASALGGAALVLALADPADVCRVGFRLSFAAAAGIAWLAGPWQRRWSRRHRLLQRFPAVRQDRPVRLVVGAYVWRALPVSVAAWLATQALVAHAFGVVTPLAPVTNVVIGPVVAVLLPSIALVAVGLEAMAGPVTGAARTLGWLLARASAAPGGFFLFEPPPLPAVLLWLGGCVLLRRRPKAAVVILVGAYAHAGAPAIPRRAELIMLDVGHGQAVLLRFRDGGAVLVDAGSRSRPGVDRRSILPALRALRVARLRAVVCTHADADHWNAIPTLLGLLPVDRVVTGPDPPPALIAAARRHGVPLVCAAPGKVIHADAGGRLTVLAAGPGAGLRANDRSIPLLFEAEGARVLLPADREGAGLRALLARGLPRCEILVAPHHGAHCAASDRVGAAVRPRYLLVSAARGCAHAGTLAAYGAAHTLVTARDGCIFVRFPAPGRIEVTTFRANIRPP
ncbi:MAG: ComEC/Rec2 family competence protein [Planctomycetota bacterium]|jgi:competence protein ComEC